MVRQHFSAFIAIAIAIAMIVASGALVWRSNAQQVLQAEWVSHTYQVIDALDAVEAVLAEGDMGVRGYLLSGDVRFLQPYQKFVQQIHAKYQAVLSLTSDNVQQQHTLQQMQISLEQNAALLHEMVTDRNTNQPVNMPSVQAENMQQVVLHTTIDQMRLRETVLLQQRILRTSLAVQHTQKQIFVTIMLCVTSLALAFILIVKQLQQRNHGLEKIKTINDALRKFSLAVDQNPTGIVMLDLTGRIEYVNRAFVTLSRYASSDLLGEAFHLLQVNNDSNNAYRKMWMGLSNGRSWEGELPLKTQHGEVLITAANSFPVRNTVGDLTHYIVTQKDLSVERSAQEKADFLTYFDTLTKLPNRTRLNQQWNEMMAQAKLSASSAAILFIDLDAFKEINETSGYRVGDKLLVRLARKLRTVLRDVDSLGRMGGDEFVILLSQVDKQAAARIAQQVCDLIASPILIEEHVHYVSASIGIAMYPQDGDDADALCQNADLAMHHVKSDGRNGYGFFSYDMQAQAKRALTLSSALRGAIARNELQVYYQAQVDTCSGALLGAEALLRWQHPELGMVFPAEFIPVAEANQQIIDIGDWVLRTSLTQLKAWTKAGMQALVLTVNLSSVQFRDRALFERVTTILQALELESSYLEFELTEAVAMKNPNMAIGVIDALHQRGIRVSIDDFGTGYSSLSQLKRFRVDKLKIDQSFVRDITEDPDDKAIVTAIIQMARSLNIQTVAEGVETAEQWAYLCEQGCDAIQGYLISKPLPAAEFAQFVMQYSNKVASF